MSDQKLVSAGEESDNDQAMMRGAAQLSANMAKNFVGSTGVEICLAVCMINKFLLHQDPTTLKVAAEVIGIKIDKEGVASE